MAEKGTLEDALEITRGLRAIEQMRKDINDMLAVMRIAVHHYTCVEWQLSNEVRVKIVIRDAETPKIYRYFMGVEKGEYQPPYHMLPLELVQPLWERLGDFVKTSEAEGDWATCKLDIFRAAAQVRTTQRNR